MFFNGKPLFAFVEIDAEGLGGDDVEIYDGEVEVE